MQFDVLFFTALVYHFYLVIFYIFCLCIGALFCQVFNDFKNIVFICHFL